VPAAEPGVARLVAPAREQRKAVDRLSLQQQVGKLVVLRFQGTEAPLYVRRVLRRGWASGAILFRDNVAAPAQLRALTRSLRTAGRAGGATPIVCADQEGGAIRIVSWAPPVSAPSGQRAGADARAAGKALRALGINVALAPVGDVPSVSGAALESRAFSRDARRAAGAVAAAVQGWRAAGVAPTAKHFPGLGGTTVNTDHGSTSIGGGAPTARDLAPFRAAIAAGVPLVMSSHAVYPALDRTRIASQSRAVLDTLLRGELRFNGVVMTDSIEAAAVRATGSTEEVAVRSVRAGNDIVLTTGHGSWIRTYRALLAEARASSAFRARVRTSAARVLALQDSLR
jgi:beta-N-acetylhexosaminidase